MINVTELMVDVVFMVRVPRYGSFAIKVSRGGQKSEKKNSLQKFSRNSKLLLSLEQRYKG